MFEMESGMFGVHLRRFEGDCHGCAPSRNANASSLSISESFAALYFEFSIFRIANKPENGSEMLGALFFVVFIVETSRQKGFNCFELTTFGSCPNANGNLLLKFLGWKCMGTKIPKMMQLVL